MVNTATPPRRAWGHLGWQPWEPAWQRALYGPDGFFSTGAGPAAHFRTAVHAAAGPLATAVVRLAERHGRTAVLDVGAGRGELLTALAEHPAAGGLRLHGVDVVSRPSILPSRVGWSRGLDALPPQALDGALLVAWELLDDVPCPVLEVDAEGVARTVLVEPGTGRERLGGPAPADQLAWCERWWPLSGPRTPHQQGEDLERDGHPWEGSRAEVGLPRDRLWAELVGRAADTRSGAVLLAVDYAHARDARPPEGSLVGYRRGRAVPPVPDGGCDVTAHVALDAVADAGERAGATGTVLTDQRAALLDLHLVADPASSPDPAPITDPASIADPPGERLQRLAERSRLAELLDPGSLGGFGWLVQRVGC